MPFTPDFSTDQKAGALSTMLISDTSSGTDNTITGRLIYCRKYDGSYLTPTGYTVDYIFWPLAQGTDFEIAGILDKDYCLDITVKWFSGSTVAYTKTILTLFTGYSELFLRQLTQALAANRVMITDTNFWLNKNKLRVLIDDAEQAVALLNDQTIAQFSLDEAKKLTDSISTFF